MRTKIQKALWGGMLARSTKTPDLKIKFKDANGKRQTKLVVEVGFSESYEALVDDARLWLEGVQSVSLVILAKYSETPSYRSPVRDLSDENIQHLGFPAASELSESSFTLEGEYGPATYKGLVWVGRISEAFLEVWKRNLETGLAERVGDRIVSVSMLDSFIYAKVPFTGPLFGY